LETFTEAKPFVENPRYFQDRRDTLAALDLSSIDKPIVDIIDGFSQLTQGFTQQSCCGHFLSAHGQDPHSLNPIPSQETGWIDYRIAYLAFCIDNSPPGKALYDGLARISESDPGYIQFGSAEWFWERHVNSYALQVEPVRYKTKDKVTLEYAEALEVQKRRDLFFGKVRELLERPWIVRGSLPRHLGKE